MRFPTELLIILLTAILAGCNTHTGDDQVKALAETWPEYNRPFVVEDEPQDTQPSNSVAPPNTLPSPTMTRPVAHQERKPLMPAVRPVQDWGLQETAIDSLGRIGAPAVPGLIQALEHPDRNQRLRAAKVLARIGPDAAQAVPILIQLLNDQDDEIRKASARALGQIGPAAESAVGPLLEIIQ
ncbi:MAG: HEAT repeat domain-containing protein [Planctomycetota bacterium]